MPLKDTPLLADKVTVVYGAAGHLGSAVARAYAREGATVHLAGRTEATLRALAGDIAATGGTAHVGVVDALDEAAVDAHAEEVVRLSGRIDVSVNLIADQDVQGTPLVDMDVADFLRPVEVALRSKFLTARAAARHMVPRGGGVILYVGGHFDWTVSREVSVGGMGVTFDAVEGLRNQLSAELGRRGVRVVTLVSSGFPESIAPEYLEGNEALLEMLTERTALGRNATLAELGDVAAFVSSDLARSVNGTVDISSGAR